MHEDFTENLIGACVAGEVDLGLVALPIDDARVAVEPLFSEQLLVALAPGHLLAKRRRITLDELTRERFVLLSEIHCLGTQIVTVQEMVTMGQGRSLVPEMAARADKSRRLSYPFGEPGLPYARDGLAQASLHGSAGGGHDRDHAPRGETSRQITKEMERSPAVNCPTARGQLERVNTKTPQRKTGPLIVSRFATCRLLVARGRSLYLRL